MDYSCKCGKTVPQKRYEMGYKNCVECSTVEKYGCVDIVYHKTGNTIEVMDAESAEKIAKLSKRRGFGSMISLRGSSGGKTNGTSVSVSTRKIPSKEDFEKIGELVMKEYEALGLEYALEVIEKHLKRENITPLQAKNLKIIFETLENPPREEEKQVYWKPETREPKPDVDPEITEIMKYWKR
jgi:hypothetical protein